MEKAIIEAKVIPKSKKEEIIKEGETIKIKVKSPPEKGKANEACIKLLSRKLKVPKSSIKILKGKTSKHKVFLISGIDKKKLLNFITQKEE